MCISAHMQQSCRKERKSTEYQESAQNQHCNGEDHTGNNANHCQDLNRPIESGLVGNTGQGNHQVDGNHIGEAADNAAHDLALVVQANQADDNAHQQEPDGGIIEPPPAEGVAGQESGPAESIERALGQVFPGNRRTDRK